MIATLPLPHRNRLAEMILAALHDRRARSDLVALATDVSRSRQWLGEDATHSERLRARARRAAQALESRPLPGGEAVGEDDDALERALDDAALLFDAGLYFEVHEVLEPHWQQASGQMREALQGLIQIAVGYQHLANGNVRGARSLLADGAARITARVIKGRPLRRFAQQVLESAASSPASIPPFPRTA